MDVSSAGPSLAPVAAGLRAAADARLTKEVLPAGGAASPELGRALDALELEGRTVAAAAVLKIADEQVAEVLDLLA